MLIKKTVCFSLLSMLLSTQVHAETNRFPLLANGHKHQFLEKKELGKQHETPDLFEGMYEFKITDTYHISYFFRVLIMSADKYPEFSYLFDSHKIIPTPLSYSADGDTFMIDNTLHVRDTGKSDTNTPIIYLHSHHSYSPPRMLEFTDESSGNLTFYDENYVKQIEGTFELVNIINIDHLNLEYTRYPTKIKRVNTKQFPDLKPCSSNNYEGFTGFIKIPELFANTANGWMVGMDVKHDSCSVHITHSLGGNLESNLVIKDSMISSQINLENGAIASIDLDRLVLIKGLPENGQALSGKIYRNELYEKVPEVLDLEIGE